MRSSTFSMRLNMGLRPTVMEVQKHRLVISDRSSAWDQFESLIPRDQLRQSLGFHNCLTLQHKLLTGPGMRSSCPTKCSTNRVVCSCLALSLGLVKGVCRRVASSGEKRVNTFALLSSRLEKWATLARLPMVQVHPEIGTFGSNVQAALDLSFYRGGELFRLEGEGLMGAPSRDGTSIASLGRAVVASVLVLGTMVAGVLTASASEVVFDVPVSVALSGTHVWVANFSGNSVTELNESNGSRVRVINAKADGFIAPNGVAVSGTHVWVTNFSGNSVTELNASNGSLVRVINATADGFNAPVGVAVSGTHVWVANFSGNSVTELNASNGSLVRVINAKADGFNALSSVTE